jgi:hypothetical protein
MGLLDEAIREHLELKRRRGADPSEIARAEHEALEPVFPEEPAQDATSETAGEPPQEPDVPGAVDADGVVTTDGEAVQETAELDMEAVLEEHAPEADGSSAAPVAARPADAHEGEEDALEWEVPASAGGEGAPEDVPGQERLTFE